MNKRHLVLAALGTGALVALASVEREPERFPEVRAMEGRAERSLEKTAPPDIPLTLRERPLPRVGEAFGPRSWTPPTKPAAGPPPPPRPVAPALPFDFLGRVEDKGAPTVILRRGKDVVLARERQNIDAAYRLEAIGPDGLVITYLPLDQQQVLPYSRNR